MCQVCFEYATGVVELPMVAAAAAVVVAAAAVAAVAVAAAQLRRPYSSLAWALGRRLEWRARRVGWGRYVARWQMLTAIKKNIKKDA